jgi:hypothetical protein
MKALTAKAGPLPLWAWALIAGVGGWWLLKRYEANAAANAATQAPASYTGPGYGEYPDYTTGPGGVISYGDSGGPTDATKTLAPTSGILTGVDLTGTGKTLAPTSGSTTNTGMKVQPSTAPKTYAAGAGIPSGVNLVGTGKILAPTSGQPTGIVNKPHAITTAHLLGG